MKVCSPPSPRLHSNPHENNMFQSITLKQSVAYINMIYFYIKQIKLDIIQ